MKNSRLEPLYTNSRALVIGINSYLYFSPLLYAVSDAQAVAQILQDKFGYLPENVELLCDGDATRTAILQKFLLFASDSVKANDRILIYFAGHGYTIHSRRGEVGYLIPYEGKLDDLSTLIRWDELTRNADLISAKHVLFVMDACYGGTAITRALQPGSMRFVKDMLLRYSRQVITAGKADELVADTGGPLPNHSMFTGHFLEALSGKAAVENDLITANGVMAYVYRNVGHDLYSKQTPHFGYLDGDGDFIFSSSILNPPIEDQNGTKEIDQLASIPAVPPEGFNGEGMNLTQQTKDFLSDPHKRIQLHDLAVQNTQEVLFITSDDNLPLNTGWSTEEFVNRLGIYEEAIRDLQTIEILVSFWGDNSHREILTKPLRLLSNRLGRKSGNTRLIALCWYPILVLTYSAGIGAIANENYSNLYELFHVRTRDESGNQSTLINALTSGMSNVNDAFKMLPDRERQYVPRSEYLYKILQPLIDDLLFLGADYESVFDQFEILFALEYAHIHGKEGHRIWGPVGRFGWKYHNWGESSPFHYVVKEAELHGNEWTPIKAGFFDGSIDRFKEIAKEYSSLISNLGWV